MKYLVITLLLSSFTILPAFAQLPSSGAPPATQSPAPAPSAPVRSNQSSQQSDNKSGGNNFLGGDVPFFNPGNEILTWDGKSWNVSNNRLFQARFEKYLNAEEEAAKTDTEYRAILDQILELLAPGRTGSGNIDKAFQLLPRASNFPIDANLCDALADAVYSVWLSKDFSARLSSANKSLEKELKAHEWNAMMASSGSSVDSSAPSGKAAKKEHAKAQRQKRDLRVAPYITRAAEVKALITANKLKREASALQAKIEFQALLVQFFTQRRFQHVLIGTRFYRSVFSDGDTLLRVGDDAKEMFAQTTGMPPTVGVLDSLANEMIRDATEGVSTYRFLLGKDELESATKRLAEAFVIGEYLPALRTLPREEKREALAFSQKGNQLVSALEVKDYALAEQLVKELAVIARDFDNSKPMAAIETARTISSMHLAKAKNAVVSGDKETVEAELTAATEIWPRNPALADVSKLIFSQADVQQKALLELDQLVSQKNYRQIFNDRMRFIAAAAMYPERQDKLRQVLEDMGNIEATIIQSTEIAKRGDYAGAWETIEETFTKFPFDNKLNQVRADLTTQAADFVRTLRKAQTLEENEQTGSSLAWYLKAQRIYPGSRFAQDGINRLVNQILPEAS